MNETNPSYEPEPPESERSTPNENSPGSFDELTDLRRRNARLQERLELLTEQLARSEERLAHLSAHYAADAEDLQPFGGSFFKPSAITSVTYSSDGIRINDHLIKTQREVPPVRWEEMQQHVEYINLQNAQRRQDAGLG